MAGSSLAPFNPSNYEVIELALDLLKPEKSDLIFDIGCGDARFLIEAAKKTQATCVGVEYDETLALRALSGDNELEDQVTILHADALTVDFSRATIVFIYLVPKGILLLKPRLDEAKRNGAKVVAYMFSIPNWEPAKIEMYKGTKVYLYS